MRREIEKALEKATRSKEVKVYHPVHEEQGDYATNVALALGERQEGEPLELAREIKSKILRYKDIKILVEKIEIAPPGFINFWIKEERLIEAIRNSLPLRSPDLRSGLWRVVFEYGQPNTHKLPHIGHLFSYIYGQSMTAILEASGSKVVRVNYQGDIGLHVAKAIWALKKFKSKVPGSNSDRVKLLQKSYEKGSALYEESKQVRDEVNQVNQAIYAKDKSVYDIWRQTRQWSLDYYKEFEKRLGIKYDKYYFESEVYEEGRRIVEENVLSVFKKSEGAIIFEGSKYGLHDRVFVTSVGAPTYEAKDMYLQELKFIEYPEADLLVITTANEQNEYFRVVFEALTRLHPNYKGKLKHIGFGMVNLKSGKMSSRTGNIIGAIELVDEVVDRVKQKYDMDNALAEKVGIAAVKYSFLKNNPLSNITFDLEESISDEGNSGPYLQYTFARTRSVLQKLKIENLKLEIKKQNLKLNNEELILLRYLSRFSEAVLDSADNYSPNILCTYLYDLAQRYNNFYNKHKIIGSKEEKLRLFLTQKVGNTLKMGLSLLGIEAPERM